MDRRLPLPSRPHQAVCGVTLVFWELRGTEGSLPLVLLSHYPWWLSLLRKLFLDVSHSHLRPRCCNFPDEAHLKGDSPQLPFWELTASSIVFNTNTLIHGHLFSSQMLMGRCSAQSLAFQEDYSPKWVVWHSRPFHSWLTSTNQGTPFTNQTVLCLCYLVIQNASLV